MQNKVANRGSGSLVYIHPAMMNTSRHTAKGLRSWQPRIAPRAIARNSSRFATSCAYAARGTDLVGTERRAACLPVVAKGVGQEDPS
jgi:hypothetical protein